jgi:hypothetical protein
LPFQSLDPEASAGNVLVILDHNRLAIRPKVSAPGFGPVPAESASSSREASDASSIKRQPARAERRVPLNWVEGVDRLQYHRPMTGVPHHRWRQFIDDCTKFLNSKWAERAAQLGWEAWVLFGCCRDRPPGAS